MSRASRELAAAVRAGEVSPRPALSLERLGRLLVQLDGLHGERGHADVTLRDLRVVLRRAGAASLPLETAVELLELVAAVDGDPRERLPIRRMELLLADVPL